MVQNQFKLFDSLTHIKKNGRWYNTSYDASIESLLNETKDTVSHALIVGMPDDDKKTILNSCQTSKKFLPIAPTIFNDETSVLDIEQDILESYELGFKGIKIHPRFLDINLNSNNIKVAINKANELGLVSLLCTFHRHPSKPLGRPVYDSIHDICCSTEGAKLILLHGGDFDLLATSEIIRPFENVILDLSSTLLRYQGSSIDYDIKYLLRTFDRRLSIGSDFPERTPKEVMNVIMQHFSELNVSESKMKNILSGNLEKLFGVQYE